MDTLKLELLRLSALINASNMMILCRCAIIVVVVIHCTVVSPPPPPRVIAAADPPGRWSLLLSNAGIASMHTAVTRYGTVIFLDRTNVGPSLINATRCRDNPLDYTLTHDCTAHSVLFTPNATSSSVRPLSIFSDTWCSSGQFSPDGTLVQTGGDNDGLFRVRRFTPCSQGTASCDWVESTDVYLQDGRWYASNQLLPDGRQIVVGGRGVFTYEFIPPVSGTGETTTTTTYLPFLSDPNDAQNDNLYPFLHLLPDGNLFIFANRDSIVYDYRTSQVVKTLPRIPGEPRNYPSAGSSVMLPLTAAANSFKRVEILVCGGAQLGCFLNPGAALPKASQTCGRMVVSSRNPKWAMESMPVARTMGDMLFLANGEVLIINGAQNGCQGWGNAANPTLSPLVYSPSASSPHKRFVTQAATRIARVYHSTANLLPDGSVLVAGSNSHQFYTFSGSFPTELRVEAFYPAYRDAANDGDRPTITSAPAPATVGYGSRFNVVVKLKNTPPQKMGVNLISSPFTTHSYSQGLRFLRLNVKSQVAVGDGSYALTVSTPHKAAIAPPSYYMLFVENLGIPSASASWIQISATTT